MPNWCNNNLTLTGPKDVLDEIAATNLLLQNIFPCPKQLRDTVSPANAKKANKNIKEHGYADWYDWQVNNWGTKWDIGPLNMEIEIIDNEHRIYVDFGSAWSPPIGAMRKLFEKYKDRGLNIRMEYYEGGCAFLGVVETIDGEFIDNYREFSGADDLEHQAKVLGSALAESEAQILREFEEEQAEEANF